MSIDFRKALIKTTKEFKIHYSELEAVCGIANQNISSYCRGTRGMTADNLEKVISALPAKAKVYFFGLLSSSSLSD